MKFGGASVATTTALTQVVSIILQEIERWDRIIVIASALEGVTDALLEAAQLASLSNRRGYRRLIANVRARHMTLVDELPLSNDERNALHADIDQLLFDMLDVCQNLSDIPAETNVTIESAPQIDMIVSVGERLAARVIAALLRENNLRGVALDATELIVTDDIFGNARPDVEATRARINRDLMPMLERDIIPVVTGFIGATLDGRITTLGRGGSDYSAAMIGVCTDSSEVWMWTDVDGMMTADPSDVDEVRVVPTLSYEEVAELAYFGARILHARMVEPLQQADIPLLIKNVFKPQQPGTIIQQTPQPSETRIKAVTRIQGISLRSNANGPLEDILSTINQSFKTTTGNKADVMFSSQSAQGSFICFVIPTAVGLDGLTLIEKHLKETLQEYPQHAHWQMQSVDVLTIIGNIGQQYTSIMAQVFSALGDLPILIAAPGPSACSLSIVVTPSLSDTALSRIHQLIRV